jgi:hypothetical protein
LEMPLTGTDLDPISAAKMYADRLKQSGSGTFTPNPYAPKEEDA